MVVPFPQKGDIFINNMEQKNILHQETKERYERELQRKNELNSMISVPIAFISVLVGCLGYFFSHIPDNSNFFLSFLFYLFLLVSIAGVVICFIFVYRHQTGYKYEYVSDPAVLHDYMEKFANQLKEQDIEPTDEVLNAEIEDVLYEQQLEATSKNIKCNDQKVFCYRHAHQGAGRFPGEGALGIAREGEPGRQRLGQAGRAYPMRSEAQRENRRCRKKAGEEEQEG